MNFFSIGSYLFGADKKKVVIQPSTTLLNFSDEKDEMQSLNSEKDNQNHHDKHWSRKRCIQNYGSDYSESNSDKSNTKSISANKSQKKKRSCGLVNSDYELSRNCYASDVPNSSESDSDDDLTEKHIMNHDVVDFNDDRDFNHGILLNIFKGDFVHIKANMDSKRNNEVLKAVLLKSIKDYSHLNKLLSLVIIEYFLYHFQPSLVALKGNWPNLLNSLGNTSCLISKCFTSLIIISLQFQVICL